MKWLPLLFVATAAHADVAVDAQIFVDGDYQKDYSQIVLDRGEAGVTVGLGKYAAAELRLEAIRSAKDGGALGIAGDSLVARIKRAQITGGYQLTDLVRLDGAAGLAYDPWIAALELGDTELPLARTADETLLGDSPSDLSFIARATVGIASATLCVGNGEGLSYPERNTGKTTTGIIEVRPIDGLRVAVMGRDGSLGPASVRNHRLGGLASLHLDIVDAGVEVDRAYGLDGMSELTGTALAGWGEVRPIPYGIVAARGATLRLDGGSRNTFGGGVAVEPTSGLRVWLAVDRTTSHGTAMPLFTDPGDATTVMLIVSATKRFTWN